MLRTKHSKRYVPAVRYALAVAVLFVVAFGLQGLAAALVVFTFWLSVSARRMWPLVAVLSVLVVLFLLSPVHATSREPSKQMQAAYSMQEILLYLINVAAKQDRFPPVGTRDARERLLPSWRIRLLSILGEEELLNRFELDEPWDSPTNEELIWELDALWFRGAQAPTDSRNTGYLLVTGPGTVFAEDVRLGLDDIPDGTAETGILVEIAPERPAVLWTEPRELTLDEVVAAWGRHDGPIQLQMHRSNDVYTEYTFYWVGMADGSVRRVSTALSPEEVRSLFLLNDGRGMSSVETVNNERVKWRPIILHGLCGLLALLPLGVRSLRESLRTCYFALIATLSSRKMLP